MTKPYPFTVVISRQTLKGLCSGCHWLCSIILLEVVINCLWELLCASGDCLPATRLVQIMP